MRRNTFLNYFGEWINRRSRRAFERGRHLVHTYYYRESWKRYSDKYWEEDAAETFGVEGVSNPTLKIVKG